VWLLALFVSLAACLFFHTTCFTRWLLPSLGLLLIITLTKIAKMQISRSNPTQPLGLYFRASEFFPHDGSGETFEINDALIEFLNELRAAWGRPITVTSGARSPATQNALFAAGDTTATKGSKHIPDVNGEVNACDITSYPFDEFVVFLGTQKPLFDRYSINGVNVYRSDLHVHVDRRPGRRVHWGGPLVFWKAPQVNK